MQNNERYRILIVDDEIANINFYKVALARLPIDIDTATSGGEAYEMILKNQYDLMTLDLLMPNVTGIGFLQKADREGTQLPIVLVCSSVSDKNIIAQAMMLGAGGYIMKPIAYQKFVQTICDYLGIPLSDGGVKTAPPPIISAQQQSTANPDILYQSGLRSPDAIAKLKTNQPLQTGRVESLSRAMSMMVFHKQTGKIEVQTLNGVGVLAYEFGRLKSVSYANEIGIEALEELRADVHQRISVQID